jgi:hypothetical protein
MHELLTDAEKEKMMAAGEEFYTEYFAEGENDDDFHAESGSPLHRYYLRYLYSICPPPLPSNTPSPALFPHQSPMMKIATSLTRSRLKTAAQRILTKLCAWKRKWRKSAVAPRRWRAR